MNMGMAMSPRYRFFIRPLPSPAPDRPPGLAGM